MITEIAFTGSPVTDMKRAREFYEGVLGLKPAMESAGGMWIEYEIGNGTFAIGCYGDQWKPSKDGTGIAFEVDDFDARSPRQSHPLQTQCRFRLWMVSIGRRNN